MGNRVKQIIASNKRAGRIDLKEDLTDALRAEQTLRGNLPYEDKGLIASIQLGADGKYELEVQTPSTMTGFVAYEAAASLIDELKQVRSGSFKWEDSWSDGIMRASRPPKPHQRSTHCFSARSLEDAIGAINNILSPEIEPIDASKYVSVGRSR